jgi:hypothetical protein
LNKYKFAKYAPILPVLIPVVFIILLAVVYPKEIDTQNIKSSVSITENSVSVRFDSIYSFEKMYDYQVVYSNDVLKIYVRKSAFIGNSWPLLIDIPNNYPYLKEIRLMGTHGPQTIYTK